jgi:hypothetical protein
MKKLAMLLVVLALCLPSYGDILIYKVTIAGRAISEDEDGASIGSGTIRGYEVVDVNVADVNNPVIEDDALIVYGKDDDGDKLQVNVENVIAEEDGYIQLEMEKAGHWAVGVEVESFTDAVLIGKAKEIDIGFGKTEKRIVAKSLTGHGILWGDPISEEGLIGSGKVTAELKTDWTKDANEEETAFDDVVAGIQDYLTDKGYEDITE